MAYDEKLAERVRKLLLGRAGYSERRMFGGICFMINGNMCCGVERERLMLRLGDELAAAALSKPHVHPMDFTGKPMRSMVYVDAQGVGSAAALRKWIEQAAGFAETLKPK